MMLLSIMFACLVLSTSLQDTHEAKLHPEISLTSSPVTGIVKDLTKDVKLRCELTGIESLRFEEIMTMKIERQKEDSAWEDLAHIRGDSQAITVEDPKISASGMITPKIIGSYIEVTWPIAVDNTLGIYKCNVIGLDIFMNMISEETQAMEVKEQPATAASVYNLLLLLRNKTSQERVKMEGEIANVTTINDNVLNNTQKLDNMEKEMVSVTTINDTVLNNTRKINDLNDLFHSEWPEGSFGLLRPTSECPDDPAFDFGSSAYYNFHSESSNASSPQTTYSSGNHLSTPITYRDGNINWLFLRFCFASLSKMRSSKWPAGKYCFQRDDAGRGCPDGSTYGALYLDDENENSQSFKQGTHLSVTQDWLHFCCVTSGSYSNYIDLPTRSPFYLYRYGGHCQRVHGMSFTDEYISIDTENDNNGDKWGDGPHPDGQIDNAKGKALLRLCYYS